MIKTGVVSLLRRVQKPTEGEEEPTSCVMSVAKLSSGDIFGQECDEQCLDLEINFDRLMAKKSRQINVLGLDVFRRVNFKGKILVEIVQELFQNV